MFWVRTGLDKLTSWVSGEAGDYDWEEAHAKYLSFLTPGPFQRAVAGGDVELVREMLVGASAQAYRGGAALRVSAHDRGGRERRAGAQEHAHDSPTVEMALRVRGRETMNCTHE